MPCSVPEGQSSLRASWPGLAYSASKSDWGTLIYWAMTGGLAWNIIIAAGIAISLLTLGFFLLATRLRRAAENPPLSTRDGNPGLTATRG